ncbi:LOW QUALITY PROTEIN: reverse transcriptase [Phytophthora megakarya]|uniref:Reverse transcriptase n=1 Tax=Phytophthora megakarya TaxID=4795 RepID=A0A225V5F3_9STRA|nr:LOW QUALITY PROTEIN: reverse transcriptase [Phytophthora megakarya]
MINYSRSPRASPIVVIIKKNRVDIRLCIDYRLVNSLTQLMVYPISLMNDLLEDLESALWYCSLDMASGFWVVKLTDRARLTSAFVTPFELFDWNRMSFGLKNAPQIYQRMIDNALYGFTRISKPEDHGGTLDDEEPVDPGKPSMLGRRSYVDDILIPANNWDQLCDRVEGLLEACDKWNLSVSVVKSFWGMSKVEYLGHKVSHNELETNPKDLSALTDLAFPGSLRAMQTFLGSLNYYSRFIEDYPIYASTLDLEAQDLTKVDPRCIHAYRSFRMHKAKLATTPTLHHFDRDRRATVVVYARDWAISGSLMQEYDKIYYPVMFASRTLKSNELNYGMAEKEVLVLLRILELNYNALVGRPIHVLTQHSTLAWPFRSTVLQGRFGQWAALLSPWTIETTKCVIGEDEILGSLAARITPRSEMDKALISIAPKMEPRRKIQAPIPTIRRDERLYVVSFDGSARVKRGEGGYSANL